MKKGVKVFGILKSLTLAVMMVTLACSCISAEKASDYIDGVKPGDTFKYGVHELKWVKDTNGNRLMDLAEVQSKKKGKWVNLTAPEFKITVTRRRKGMYQPNAYIYKKTPTRDLKLYIDFPEGWKPSDKRPAMVWFYGGAWSVGEPMAFRPQSLYFAKRGVVGIRVDYRIGQVDGNAKNDVRAAMDGKTAVRWVRKNAAKLGIDPDKIMAGGGSAGGHVAAATQIPTMNDPNDDTSISAKLAALMLQSPYVVHFSEESWLFQMDFKKLCPVWVGYGTDDAAAYVDNPKAKHTVQNGESFIAELKKAGIPLRAYIKEKMNHGFCSGPFLDDSTRDIDKFLRKQGLLDTPKAEIPGEISRYPCILYGQAIDKGKYKRVVPQELAYPSK